MDVRMTTPSSEQAITEMDVPTSEIPANVETSGYCLFEGLSRLDNIKLLLAIAEHVKRYVEG